MRLLPILWRRILAAFVHVSWNVVLRLAQWRTLHGVRVGIFYGVSGAAVRAQAFAKVDAALHLMSAHDPRHLRRASRQIRRLLVWRDAYAPAYYLAPWNTCVFDVKFLMDDNTTPAAIGAVLVHEVTHARLFRLGIPYSEATRQRVEQICVAESAAFARRLPDGDELARQLVAALPSDGGHWSDQNLDRRMNDARLEELDELPLPAWLKRLHRRYLFRERPN